MPSAQQKIVINATPQECFDVIADYERYPEFLSDMESVHVLRREEGYAVVSYELDLMIRVEYTLRLFEQPPESVRWSLESAKIMKANNGSWSLVDLGDGRTEATYNLDLQLKGLIPSSVTTRLAGTTLPRTLEDFKARIEGLTGGGA